MDVDKITGEKRPVEDFSTSVSGIFNVKKYFRNGDVFSEIIEKNIFTDQPAPSIEVVRSKPSDAENRNADILLNGIIVSPDSRIALVTDKRSKQTHFLVEGETLDNWVLEKINNKSVVFTEKNGSQLVLIINEDRQD